MRFTVLLSVVFFSSDVLADVYFRLEIANNSGQKVYVEKAIDGKYSEIDLGAKEGDICVPSGEVVTVPIVTFTPDEEPVKKDALVIRAGDLKTCVEIKPSLLKQDFISIDDVSNELKIQREILQYGVGYKLVIPSLNSPLNNEPHAQPLLYSYISRIWSIMTGYVKSQFASFG